MTRINVGIHPTELPDKLLIAEHREITRIPNNLRNGKAVLKDIPEKFTLGKGHVKFFYNKVKYLSNRYALLYNECIFRGFNITDKSTSFMDFPQELFNDYIETEQDRLLLIERIQSKGFKLNEKYSI